jgi:hypothetical protein
VIATIVNGCSAFTGLLMLIVHRAFHSRLGLCPEGET